MLRRPLGYDGAVPREGFEPSKVYTAGLKPAAVGHLATAEMCKDRFERPSSALEAAVLPLDYLPRRREGDSNTRVLTDTVIPARSLDQTRETPPDGETGIRTQKPQGSRFQTEHSHLSVCLTSNRERSALPNPTSLTLGGTPRPGVEPGGRQVSATA